LCPFPNAWAEQAQPSTPQTSKPVCEPTNAQTLGFNSTVYGDLAGNQCTFYRFELPAKSYAHAVIDQRGIDLTVAILDLEEGKTVSISDVDRPTGSQGPESISWITVTQGTYFLRIGALQPDAPKGSYTVRLDRSRAPVDGDETRIKAEKAITVAEKLRASADNENLEDGVRRTRFEDAVKGFSDALNKWQALKEPYEQAVALYGLGMSYSGLGSLGMVKFPLPSFRLRWNYQARQHHQQAIEYFNQSLRIMNGLHDRYGGAINQAGMAWPNLYLGRQKEARGNFSAAFELFRSVHDPKGEGIALYGIGWAYALVNQNDRALTYFSRALPHRKAANDNTGLAITTASIARIKSRLGNYKDALDYCEQALQLFRGRRHGTASTLSVRGWIYYAMKDFEKARDTFQTVQRLRSELKDSTGEANALYGIARVDNAQGHLTEALAEMKKVVDMIELLRDKGTSDEVRTYYFANVQEYYEFYVDLLMRAQDDAGALGVNERARARELLATLAESETDARDVDRSWASPLEASQIRSLLDEQTLLLEFALGEERSYVWLVSKDNVHGYNLPERATLETKAQQLYQLMTERNRQKPGETEAQRELRIKNADARSLKEGAELSRILLGPISNKLERKRLVIVTQGALQFVPFAALPTPASEFQPDGDLLITDHEIVNLPSASILAALRHKVDGRTPAPKTVAVLADPVFTGDDPRVRASANQPYSRRQLFSPRRNEVLLKAKPVDSREGASTEYLPRLGGTRWEAEQIVSLVAAQDSLLALDFAANRAKALDRQLAQFRIVHFATHALIDDTDPVLSKIVLSRVDEQGNPLNGSVTLEDIYKLQLPAELVVLSACRTGLGKNILGEGLVGMTGSFMHAGAPRIIVSLWPVKDDVTADFMVKFYRHMLGSKPLPSAAALQEAQIEMKEIARSRPAYFWAPFIQQGEWR
jgi:CHAT domain-containing protein